MSVTALLLIAWIVAELEVAVLIGAHLRNQRRLGERLTLASLTRHLFH